MNQLAIVIPAYKIEFLEQTLKSISNQSVKDFTLYIGDDASNYDIYSIVKNYEQIINIHYKRFEDNLGSVDLVAHWERCVELVKDEEWIWLFSDDDIMDSDCIASFLRNLKEDNTFNLFHFDIQIIDERNRVIFTGNYPLIFTIKDYIEARLKNTIESFAVEYIFRKSTYIDNKKFKKFDLAWCSDDATWIKFGLNKGIKTIKGSYVSWRRSSYNISCNSLDKSLLIRKYFAFIEFANWLREIVNQEQINLEDSYFKLIIKAWYRSKIKSSIQQLNNDDLKLLMGSFNKKLETRHFVKSDLILFQIYKAFYHIKERIRIMKLSII